MEKSTNVEKEELPARRSLINLVFSWSLGDVLNKALYKNQVYFDNNFKISISRIKNAEIRSAVLSLLAKLTSGWRQPHERRNLIVHGGTSSELLEVYKVNWQLNLVWTVDILNEYSHHIQVMKVWDVARLFDIQKLAKQLDIVFGSYTADKMHRCKHRCLEGSLVVPMRWPMESTSHPEHYSVRYLSRPLSSLSLRDKPETSAATSRNHFKNEIKNKSEDVGMKQK